MALTRPLPQVTATSVGYGDITPKTFAGQYFLTFYVLVSTTITMDVLGSAVHLYVDGHIGERIIVEIIESTTDVSAP